MIEPLEPATETQRHGENPKRKKLTAMIFGVKP
jgi:hypothetical protein